MVINNSDIKYLAGKYPYLTENEIITDINLAHKLAHDGEINQSDITSELTKILTFDNDQNKPLTYSQWYAKQLF